VLHTIRDDKDEVTKEGVPTGGLELQFNELLKGKEGRRLFIHSPRNPLEVGQVLKAPEDGADIYLTINHYLQAIAEEEIAKAVITAKAKAGWAVMMDPYTGEILALAQYPFFEPANYRIYFNDPELVENTKVKAVSDANEIGSTMKPITLAVCFRANEELKKRGEKPILDPNEKVPTGDGTFPGRKKLKDLSYHRFMNMYQAIWKSSNIYVARKIDQVIKTLGNQWYKEELENSFCFGKKTGIELPGESSGVVPQPGKIHPNGRLEWSLPTPYSLAMGHNIQATSMQMLRAYAIFANGGVLVEPTLVRKIVRERGDGIKEVLLDNTLPSRIERFPRIMDASVLAELIKAMKYTTKPGGTACKGDIYGYTEIGKTSSVEKIVNGMYAKNHNVSSFIGFAPVSPARFVLLVTIDEPEAVYIPGFGRMSLGGKCAVPAFQAIGARSLAYLGVTPDDPYGYPPGDPRYDAGKADWIKETKELQALYDSWNK
jgi:cell division protein FtsI (penicillin-binding protein 3)